ncbi:hypothetical protein B0H16DRAFT_1695513 [Mycena metata]|uniref:Uncharacterized protein n=1 Tax=Mycena metata TaxID=1033252 RepID=A0AAD7MX09_9AGAR|nr:hypothetical protein B0H16DRAFT_1695513 [Mycena metata]
MFEAALILWLLSPVLGNTLRYIILGLLLMLLVAYIVGYYTPSRMVVRLENAIKTLRNTLKHAKNCPMALAKLAEMGCQLTQVEVSVPGIRGQLLDMGSLETWKEYFQGLRGIFKTIRECNKEVKDIQTSVLRIVEGEHERQLLMRVEEERGILNALMDHVEEIGLVRRRRLRIVDTLPEHISRTSAKWSSLVPKVASVLSRSEAHAEEKVAGRKVNEGKVEVQEASDLWIVEVDLCTKIVEQARIKREPAISTKADENVTLSSRKPG